MPIVAFFVGFFGASTLGGMNALYNIFNKVPSWNGTATPGRLAGLTLLALWGAIGTVFWHFGNQDGIWYKLLGRGLGGFFWGAGVAYIPQIIQPSPATDGALDKLQQWGQRAAGGG